MVAPLAGSVDRNSSWMIFLKQKRCVAPLAGSVDRNMAGAYLILADELVAPLAGSVDRNILALVQRVVTGSGRSPRGERG